MNLLFVYVCIWMGSNTGKYLCAAGKSLNTTVLLNDTHIIHAYMHYIKKIYMCIYTFTFTCNNAEFFCIFVAWLSLNILNTDLYVCTHTRWKNTKQFTLVSDNRIINRCCNIWWRLYGRWWRQRLRTGCFMQLK